MIDIPENAQVPPGPDPNEDAGRDIFEGKVS